MTETDYTTLENDPKTDYFEVNPATHFRDMEGNIHPMSDYKGPEVDGNDCTPLWLVSKAVWQAALVKHSDGRYQVILGMLRDREREVQNLTAALNTIVKSLEGTLQALASYIKRDQKTEEKKTGE